MTEKEAKKEQKQDGTMEKIISLCKRRGFVFPGSEIYGGLSGTWDYGHYGSVLAHNIKELWWKHFVTEQENIFSITTPTLMPEAVWKASGHLSGFTDPVVECEKCHHRFRADQLDAENRERKSAPIVEENLAKKKFLISCYRWRLVRSRANQIPHICAGKLPRVCL